MCRKIKSEENFLPVESFSKSLAIPFDIGCDILEGTIDLSFDNEIVKSIPILKGLVAVKDISMSVLNRLIGTGVIFQNVISGNPICYNNYTITNVGKNIIKALSPEKY